MTEVEIGTVRHYYPRVHAAAVALKRPLHEGDTIHIVGHGVDLYQKVTSLEEDHKSVHEAKAGHNVGVLVSYPVREGSHVFIVA